MFHCNVLPRHHDSHGARPSALPRGIRTGTIEGVPDSWASRVRKRWVLAGSLLLRSSRASVFLFWCFVMLCCCWCDVVLLLCCCYVVCCVSCVVCCWRAWVEVLARITGGGARGKGIGTGTGYPRGTLGLKDGSARRPPFTAGRWSCACAGGAGAGAGSGSGCAGAGSGCAGKSASAAGGSAAETNTPPQHPPQLQLQFNADEV